MIMLKFTRRIFYGRVILVNDIYYDSRFADIFILTMFGIYENNGADDHIVK